MPETANPPEQKPIPELPPNMAVLVARPGPDKAHIAIEIRYDCTHLSEDRCKYLLHLVMQGLTQFERAVQDMGRIEVAAKLGQLERAKKVKTNGN